MRQLITLYRDFSSDLMSQVGGAATSAISGGIGGIMGLPLQAIGNAMQLGQQQHMADMQEQENEKFATFSEGLQKDMWNYTNYENQVKHLQAAGLNPALLYAKGGAGGTTGQVSAPAGMGIAPGGQGQAAQQINLQAQETAADIKVKEAQAHALEVEANKKAGVDTQETQANIDNVKQLTQNAQVQNEILTWEAGIKAAEATVATKTIDVSIEALHASLQNLIQNVRTATVTADLSEATKNQVIQQARNATIQQGLNMILTKAETEYKLQNIEQSKNAIQMAIQENMRKWDTMPNMSEYIMGQQLDNLLKVNKVNAPPDLIKDILHLVIPLKTKP